MSSRNINFGLLFLALCIAYCSATRCNGQVSNADRETQTPRVWQWENNPHRWWDEILSPMKLWMRPQIWSRALDHFGGLPMLPLPIGRETEFSNKLDQLFDDFFEDPWAESEVGALEDQSSENNNCHCSGTGQVPAREHVDVVQNDDRELRRGSQNTPENAYPKCRNSREQIQQNQRNTREQFEHKKHSGHELRNHQHESRVNANTGRVRDRTNNMGSFASNQQPTHHRNNLRQTNQRNLRREAQTPDTSDDYNRQNEFHRQDLHEDEDRQNFRRFGNGHHGTMPNNRDSHLHRGNNQAHSRNQVNRPVEVYSLQVPGYRPSELHVKVEGKKVRVIGRQPCSCHESCSVREFERVTVLPDGVDTRTLQATLNKEGTLSVQSKKNHRLSRGYYEDRDVLVEGLDMPPIEDSSKNTEDCVKKAGFKLAKIDKRTGKRVPVSRQFEEVPQRTFESEQEDDGVTVEIVDE